MTKAILVLLIGLISRGVFADNTVGSGGDALRKLFEDSRWIASQKISNLQWCSFNSSTPTMVTDWILNHLYELKSDIEASNHLWVVDAQATCGYTQHTLISPIYLSYPTCAATVGTHLENALFTLIHESSHHLGIDDEKQADLIATAVLSAQTGITCPNIPTDVFNSEICKGPDFSAEDAAKFLPPGTTLAPFGNYQAFAKSRRCSKISGCEQFQSDKVLGINPIIYARSKNDSPYFDLWMTKSTDPISADNLFMQNSIIITTAYIKTENGAVSYLSEGSIKKNCSWFKGHGASSPNSNGQWIETNVVIYGTH